MSGIDINSGALIDTIGVGSLPWAIAVHPGANLAYVTTLGDDRVSVIDTTTNTVVTTVPVGDNPQSIAINDVKDKAYVGNLGVIGAGNDTVTIINTTNHQVIDTVTVGQDPMGIAIADHGNSNGVFVGLSGLEVKVIHVDDDTITHTIPIPPSASGPSSIQDLAYHRVVGRVYVLRESLLTAIYPVTKVVADTYPLVVAPATAAARLAVNGFVGGGRIYTVHPQSDDLSVYEYVNHSREAQVAVGGLPTHLAFAGDPHNKVLVSNCLDDYVSVFDIDTNTVVDAIDVGDCPRGVAVIP